MTGCGTETLDKLYLEWSQFTSARNAREIDADVAMGNAMAMLEFGDEHEAYRLLGEARERMKR